MTLSDLLNTIGGVEMAISFIVIGIVCLVYAKHGERPYRRKMAVLFGIFILTSGISRGVGVFAQYHSLDLLNGILKVISGTTGMIAMFLVPKSIKEIARVQSIERTHEEMEETKKAVDRLTDISNKLNIRNPT